jgi:signal transduction histidine kinase
MASRKGTYKTGPHGASAGGKESTTAENLDQVLGATVRMLMGAVNLDIGGELSTETTATLLVEQVRRLLPGTQCMVAMLAPERQDWFHVVAASGPWAERVTGRELPVGSSVIGRAMREGRTVDSGAVHDLSPFGELLAGAELQVARFFPLTTGTPLPDGRTSLGVFCAARTQATPFDDRERELIDDGARLAGLALHRAELWDAASRGAERLKTGVKVATDLAMSLQPRDVVRRLLVRGLKEVRADRGTMYRVDGADAVVEDSYDVLGPAEERDSRRPIEEMPRLQQAIEARRAVRSTEIAVGGGRVRPPGPARHVASLPLVYNGEVVGVLVLSRRFDREFTVADLDTLHLIGNFAVLALRNATLYAEVQAAFAARGEFINLAAHQLRTPLTVISGLLELMRDGSLGPAPSAWGDAMEMMSAKSGELRELVDDLLMASWLEAGHLAQDLEQIDLRDAVSEAMARSRPRARLAQARVVHRVPDHPVPVRADRRHLGHILDNLVNNALAYQRGRPWVRITVTDADSPRVAVEDHGVGIAASYSERIFERFFRLEDPIKGHAGTGLGLSISRELAERLGGSLTLERSEPGRGSEFALRLPPAGSERAARKPRAGATATRRSA